jgi:hypothetical protein
MVFEMVQGMLKDAIIDAILVFVCLIGLLPLEVDEELLAIRCFSPMTTSREHSSNKIAIISTSDVKLIALL